LEKKKQGARKMRMSRLFPLMAALLILLFSTAASAAVGKVELKVYDPRAELWAPPVTPIQPRLATLDGKKIALLNNTKPGADFIRPHIEKVLKEKFPKAEIREFVISYNAYPSKRDDMKVVKDWADAVIGLLGD
jgi:hypothetical protein